MPTTDFTQRTETFRGELLAHCYHMLGSLHDAEDLVQETLLRAWRAREQYDATRASLRTWLYRIATNACLNALEGSRRRPLPSGLGAPSDDPEQPLQRALETPWLQPFPDAALRAERSDPAEVLLLRGSMRLALVAAMQHLPPRQRAILILREVLQWSAVEVAEALETSAAAVNSGLQRARARLAEVGVSEEQLAEPADPDDRAVIESYIAAFEKADIDALKLLLTDKAVLEMPPVLNWYRGRDDYGAFIARILAMRGTDWRMLPIEANSQPGVAAYVREEDGVYRAHTVQVFTVADGLVSHNVVFQDAELFRRFGLPEQLDD
ncbi:RNA polymerase subunit sigma-70 [Kitasatospora sp. Root187]|nr:RNA polymerase subunit sigma-70 [Kitasatospora sp. Root107]KRB75681.1 RNA polymerase subunit sigma-70 [Kitasatospora sp. Root187]